MTRDEEAGRREIVGRLDRIILALEHQALQSDRTNRLLADISAKVAAALRYFVDAWKVVRGERR
jgi:hypothetical protein